MTTPQASKVKSKSSTMGTYATSLCTQVTVRPMIRMKAIMIDVLVKNALASENIGAIITYIAALSRSERTGISAICWPKPYVVPTVTRLVQTMANIFRLVSGFVVVQDGKLSECGSYRAQNDYLPMRQA